MSIRGRTTGRRNGRIIIRTEMGTNMSFKDNGLPLFISVLVLYDYTTNQIRDVVRAEELSEDHEFLELNPEEEEKEEIEYDDEYAQDGDKGEIVEVEEESTLFDEDDPIGLEFEDAY